MAEGKGKWTSVFKTGGNRFIIRNERRADVASIPTKVEGAADYANLIVAAVNTYPAVERLVKALEGARQFITNGIELGYIRMPDSDTPDPAHQRLPQIEAALYRFRSLQNGSTSSPGQG